MKIYHLAVNLYHVDLMKNNKECSCQGSSLWQLWMSYLRFSWQTNKWRQKYDLLRRGDKRQMSHICSNVAHLLCWWRV